MITSIELDGFKDFHHFSMNFGAFNVLLNQTGSGESDIVEAIKLISQLATAPSLATVLDYDDSYFIDNQSISLAVEVLLNPAVGENSIKLQYTRVRYALEIAKRADDQGREQLMVVKEQVSSIQAEHDQWLRGPYQPSASFVHAYIRTKEPRVFLKTESRSDGSMLVKFDDQQHREQTSFNLKRTLLSLQNAGQPHLYALQTELASYKMLPLELFGSRVSNSVQIPKDKLPAVFANLPSEVQVTVKARLASLIPNLVDIQVDPDYQLTISMRNSPYNSKPTKAILSILPILTMLARPDSQGLLCLDQPEQGLTPTQLSKLIEMLRELVSLPITVTEVVPLAQLIINSYSPVVLANVDLDRGEVSFVDMVTVVGGGKPISRRLMSRPVILDSALAALTQSRLVSKIEVESCLDSTS